MFFCRVAVVIGLLAVNSFAQDPVKSLPEAYKLQFENDWVKVTRVHYAPHVKLPAHEHTLTAAAYVYLNDSGPVVFNHTDQSFGAVTRQPTKAGGFRLFRSVQEHHEVENKSELPSDFLRIEFKTEPVNEKNLKGKFYREDYPAGQNFEKVQFENEQVRITRLVCAAGKKLNVTTSAGEPSLLVALTPASLKVSRSKAKAARSELAAGQTRWVDQQEQIENTAAAPAEMLRFDFKTKPLSKEELEKKKPHEHSKN